MNANQLITTAAIAKEIGRDHEETLKLLKKLGYKPYRETRTESRTFRHWHKSVVNDLKVHIEEKRKERETAATPEPVTPEPTPIQAELNLGVDIDAAHKIPPIDLTILETKHAEEMLSVLRSIDVSLAKLVAIWAK